MIWSRFSVTILCTLFLSFTGCGGSKSTTRNSVEGQSQIDRMPEYKLGFGDELEVKFFRNTQFNESVKVRPDGRISLQKVGDIYVAGMSPSELDSVITDVYSGIIREPDVTVIVREFGGYQVYVLGEVTRPGGVPIQRGMTVLQAIAAAGGTTVSAKMSSVMLLRKEDQQEAQAYRLNLARTLKSRPGSVPPDDEDIFIEPMDVVFVPKTFIGGAADFMTQLYATVLPPLDVYLRALIIRDAIR